MSESSANDLAAARDAHELNGILQSDVSKGATVHTFDPNTSPRAKGALAGQARDELKSTTRTGNTPGGEELSLDTGRGPPVAPTITILDVDKVQEDERASGEAAAPQTTTDDRDLLPGAIPDTLAANIPDWYRVGWQAVSGVNTTSPTDQEAIDKGALTAFIKEQYYGEWYHNAGIIFFSVVASHFLTLFNMGWGSLIVLLAVCGTYYSTSLARVRRRARDDIQRELVKTRLLSEHESADWINHFLDRFWLIYEPVLSATIVSSVDQILSANTPPFLDSVRLTTFTLGTKAPRIDSVRTFPKTADDVVMMDWGISFTPNDISDLTQRQAESKVNPKIVLSIRLGKGFASAAMPILLEDIGLTGLMRIRLKLMTNFPHIQIVDISFIEKPFIDYVLKPIGGEHFGFDIANIPGLSSFIRDMTHSTLGPMMYDPNVFTLNLEQLLSGTPLDSAIGVLQLTLHHARGLKATKIGGGAPDPYVTLSINQRAALARTKHKDSTFTPTWHETKFLLINSLAEVLTMNVMDYNEHFKDSELGIATFELNKLHEDATLEGVVVPVIRDGKSRGELRIDVSFYPVLLPKKVDGREEPIPETSVGIVRLTIHQAKDLDHSKSLSGDLNPFARVILGSQHHPIHSTPLRKHTNSPVWESSAEFLCTDRASSVITINIVDDRDFLADPTVGFLSVKLEDLLEAQKEAGRDWWPLSGCKTGRLRLTADWKPLSMAGSLQGANRYKPPIGIIRLWMQKATDVKNVEAALGGKSDPYVRVLLQNIIMARTEVVNNNLNPEWDQIVYVPVHSPKEVVLLECMDYQHLTKDRSLGSVELHVSHLVEESTEDKNYPYTSTGKKEYVEELLLDKDNTRKGQLHFVADFVPAMFLKGVRFDAPQNEIQQVLDEHHADSSDSVNTTNSDDKQKTPSQDDAAEEDKSFQPGHAKGLKSTDTSRTVNTTYTVETSKTSATGYTTGTVDESKYEGLEMTKEQLLNHQSGIIVFNLIGGQLSKKSRLEVLLDEGYWPAVATTKSRSTRARFDVIGEGFVKELDFGQVCLRLNENDDSEKEDIVAECRLDAKAFLERTLDGPTKFTLQDEDEKNESIVELAAKYIPVPISLEPRESINNQGVLHIELIDGKDILAADRSGKSDPFAIFTLNDQKVYRSQVKKKTLRPDWNENFDVSVPSRVGSHFEVEVLDWNQIEQSKSLGSGKIDLESIEPFQGTTRTISLNTLKHGTKGEIRINLLFQPGIIAKSRKNTSTFSTAGRAMTQVGALPLGAGKGLVHGVGAAGKNMIGVFMRDHGVSGSKTSLEIPPNGHPRGSLDDSLPATQLSRPADSTDKASAGLSPSRIVPIQGSNGGPRVPDDFGVLKVTVLGAKDLVGTSVGDTVKPYVVVRVGDKEQKTKHTGKTVTPEWDETFRFIVGPETTTFTATLIDHKTIGKDRHLGEAVVDIWNHIRPLGPAADVWVELQEGEGLLRLRLEFEKVAQGSLLSSTGSPPSSPSIFTSVRRSTTRDRS
ncbi:tricalbin [Gautieria morchelliformis]|nr:tricalbin [Gautieria morchelliformis]